MDIRIRGSLDGVETARLLHDRWGAPVILLTAYADEETIARAKLTQPFGYILKPFEERELKTAIEIALYRAAMEAKLRSSEERYRSLFQDGISGNFLADEGGSLVEANHAFRRLFGYAEEDALPSLPELFPDGVSYQSFRTGLLKKGNLELAELSLQGRAGKPILVFANVSLVKGPKGEISGIQGELSDLTERRRLEERLAQTQRMEAIGRLAGGIAHDFNNILTAIVGYANLLHDECGDGNPMREDVEGIKKAAGKASGLTRQLLAFSRRQTISPKVLDPRTLVTEMEKMLRRILTENISLSLSLDAATPHVFVDPTQLEQVLVNLVVNAKDAMPTGGRLLVTSRGEKIPASRAIGMDTLAPGRYAVIEVKDTGIGIEPAITSKIFEPFFTTKPKDQGTGLGLSTVYGIAKQSGGGIAVESELGRGSVFSVWIPAADPGLETSPTALTAEPVKEKARPATILFVDDDEEVRSLGERLLGRLGHRVIPAANAGEAMLIAESQGRPIDLLVSDVVMPLMDGYTLARRLSVLIPGLKILFISGYSERAEDEELSGRFLQKPFTEDEIVAAVAKALGEEALPDQGLPF